MIWWIFGNRPNRLSSKWIFNRRKYYPLERDLATELGEIAQNQGVSAETLLNLWVKEKILQQKEAVS